MRQIKWNLFQTIAVKSAVTVLEYQHELFFGAVFFN